VQPKSEKQGDFCHYAFVSFAKKNCNRETKGGYQQVSKNQKRTQQDFSIINQGIGKAKQMAENVMNQDLETRKCQTCKTVYQIRFIGPVKNYNDFGIWFCPYCAALTDDCFTEQTSKA